MYLSLERLGHRFPGHGSLFRELSADLVAGKSYALTGPSGSGKSTLLGILAGIIVPTSGVVSGPALARPSWVFQNPHGVARRSVLDHAALPYLAKGMAHREAWAHARALLHQFGLAGVENSPYKLLSGGEAQRLMLVRALASEPTLLLVDEPTAQLDLATSAVVNGALKEVSGRGVVVVVATHDAGTRASCDEVMDLGDYQAEHS